MALLLIVLVLGATLWSRVETFEFEPPGSPAGGTTILLVGSDSRAFVTSADDRRRYGASDATPGERADVLIALRLDDDGSVRLLSITRDLLVVGPTGGLIRVSEAMLSGPQAVADALCGSLGLGIDHLVVIELDGLRRIVNAIGGIDLELDTAVRDRDSGLALDAGPVHLDGDDAIAFVASRHLEHRDEAGAWVTRKEDEADRPGRAVDILRLIGADLDLSPWSPIRSARVAWAASGSLITDDGFGLSELNRLRSISGMLTSVAATRLPVTIRGGAVPVDEVAAGAGARLSAFEGSSTPRRECADPSFPAAGREP